MDENKSMQSHCKEAKWYPDQNQESWPPKSLSSGQSPRVACPIPGLCEMSGNCSARLLICLPYCRAPSDTLGLWGLTLTS